MLLQVFVYGTLKPGERNYHRYCVGEVLAQQPAIAYGELYALSVGYPAMTSGENRIAGFLLTFSSDRALIYLDNLEGYHPSREPEKNLYNRLQSDIFSLDGECLGKAWVYQMSREQINSMGGCLVADGCWSGIKQQYP